MIRTVWIVLLAVVFAVVGAPDRAGADWRAQIKVLRVGVVVGDNPRLRLQRLEPFRRRIELEAGVPVEIVPARDFNMLIDAHTSARIDYAVYSATAYAAASALCDCLEPIAAPRADDGTLGYHSLLLVHVDSGLSTLDQLKGRSIALSRSGSTAGHLVIMSELRAAGIDPVSFFKSIEHAKGVKASVKTMLLGTTDIGVAWSTLTGDASRGYARGTLRDLVLAKELEMGDIRVVWQSRRITHGPHAVTAALPRELKQRLQSALVRLKDLDASAYDAVERHYGGGFAEITESDYAPLIEIFAPVKDQDDASAKED